MADILTVSSLNLYVKSLLENDSNLFGIAVEGEISNFKRYPSGHCYFTLKDEASQIKAVMFGSYVRNLDFVPENGMKVIVRGKVSLYERDGAYQFYVTNMFLSGAGSYRIAFEKLKNKLEKEGFDAPKVTLDSSITDFYQFTKDSFKVEDYKFHPFDFEIPMAI